MAKKASVGLGKTYGTRYGKKIRDQTATYELEARRKHKCPYCNYTSVKRITTGVWHCSKCDAKFTGKAYSAKMKIANPLAVAQEKIYSGEEE